MIVLRPSGPQDLNAIWQINAKWIKPQEPEWELQKVLNKAKTWVAEDNGTIIGSLVGKIKFDMPYVHSVSVEDNYRNQGVATKLFIAFESGFGGDAYWLQTHVNNPAQKLYFDLGYRVGSVDLNFYGKGEHALCMYKGPFPK